MGRLPQTMRGGALAAVAFACGLTIAPQLPCGAHAEEVGSAYDPVIGGHWTISSTEHDEKALEGQTTTSDYTRREELTVLGKTAAGFRVGFVIREYKATGAGHEQAIQEALLGAIRDIVIRAELDASGKPVRIENLQEIAAAVDKGIDRMLALINDAEMKMKLREIIEGFTKTAFQSPETAAEQLLDTLSLLAVAQNTRLKVGEERRSTRESPNPLGGGSVKVVSVLRLADASGDKLTVTRTDSYDPVVMKEMILDLVKKLGLDKGPSGAELEKVMSQITLSIDDRTEFKVEMGMTRAVTENSIFTLSAMGHTGTKHDRIVVTVTPMQ